MVVGGLHLFFTGSKKDLTAYTILLSSMVMVLRIQPLIVPNMQYNIKKKHGQHVYDDSQPYVTHSGDTVTLFEDAGLTVPLGSFTNPFTGSFVDVSNIDVGNLSANILYVRGLSEETYNGLYLPYTACSIQSLNDYTPFGGQVQITTSDSDAEQSYPIFQNVEDSTKYLCVPQTKTNNVSTWSFFTFNGVLLSDKIETPPNSTISNTLYPDTTNWSTSLFNNFTYPVLEGTLSHNFDIHRVIDINSLHATSNTTLTIPKSSNHISFWAWTSNSPSWSLFTANSTSWSLHSNGNSSTDTSSGISLSTSDQDITLSFSYNSYISDFKQYSSEPPYQDINFHPSNPTFGILGSSHSSNIGIGGNQLDNTLSVVTSNNSLADLRIGNLLTNSFKNSKNETTHYPRSQLR